LTEDDALQYTHSGTRYLLGYGEDFFGIWDRQAGGPAIARYPRTREGWTAAWARFSAWEPQSADIGIGGRLQDAGDPGPETGPRESARPAPGSGTLNPLWWLLPILFGFLGGLVAFLVNREADPRAARAMLLVGAGLSLLVTFLIASRGGVNSSTLAP
jgi:hypothetical protein